MSHLETLVEPKASTANAPASGVNSAASPKRSHRASSSSKTSPPVQGVGCPSCGETCTCWGTEPVPTRFLPTTLEPTIEGQESSLLPTLTLKGNMLSPSMLKWAAHRRVQQKLLPTLSASTYGSNQGGAAGRVGPVRKSLRGLAGGSLSPQWCEWFMGFPRNYTKTDPILTKTASRKRAQRAISLVGASCSICRTKSRRLTRHHHDYQQATNVKILCDRCHAKVEQAEGTRRKAVVKTCILCGNTFAKYTHSRVKTCSAICLAEIGRRNANKRWERIKNEKKV
jgi:hypothetical protein